METLFTWLHLSDLHVRASDATFTRERVLTALREDIANHAEPRPDVIVVTGDLSWSGKREEFVAARRWLLETARAIGLGPERIFVVPGNHDVDRDTAGRSEGLEVRLLADLREGRRRLDLALERAAARGLLTARMAAFAELASALGPPADASSEGAVPDVDYLEWSHGVEGRGGLKVRLTGLCSVWLSTGDSDRGELRLGMVTLDRTLAATRPGELVVVACHHPLHGGWLADEHDALAWMNANGHVLLTGQVHDAAAEEARAGTYGPFVWVAAGASPAGPGQSQGRRTLGWSLAHVVRAPDGALSVRVAPRGWSSAGKRFVADEQVFQNGRAYSERPLRLRLPVPATSRATHSYPPARPDTSPPGPPYPPVPAIAQVASPPAIPAAAPVASVPPRAAVIIPPSRAPQDDFSAAMFTPPVSSREPPPPSFPPPAHRSKALFEGPGALPVMPIPYFVGRVGEMATLRTALTEGTVTCVVAVGLGGVGKTSLVQHFVATEAHAYFDESAWIDARDLPAELGRVAKRFGWPHEDRTPTVEQAGAFLRQALESRRVLLVIDNVDPGMASVRAFPVPSIAGKSRLVVTSRIVTLHEDLGILARPLRLGTWDDATCRAHFREVVPALAGEADADLNRLARRVGGLPLAVRLLAKQLLRPGVSVRSLLERLEREPLEALDSAARGAERTVVATFQSALEGLGNPVRRVLLALAACAPATRAAVVAAVSGVHEDDAALALEGLAEQSLVEWLPDAEQPFRLHDVVRLLLVSLPGAAEAEAAHDAWALAHVAAHRAPADWMALDREVTEVLAVVERRLRRGDGNGAWEALSPILGALDRRGMYGELISAGTRVLAAVTPDSIEAAAVLGNLGLAWCSLGEMGKAKSHFDRALILAIERVWLDGQALALGGLGRCHGVLGEWDKAISHHRRAAEIHEMLNHQRPFADDLGNVGLAYRKKGDVAKAIEYLEMALAIYEDEDLVDGRAEVLGGLGLCFRDIGELTHAVEYFQKALAIHEQLGRSVGQATMLGNLGNTYRSIGDVETAIAHLERALAIYEKLSLLEGQGAALGNLGACYRTKGDKERAREYFQQALGVLRRAGLPDDHPHVKMVVGAMGRGRGSRPG